MPRLRSSSSYTHDYESRPQEGEKTHSRKSRPFFVLLLVVTVTAIIFILAATAILIYFRIRHGPLLLEYFDGDHQQQECPGNQVWNDCGFVCKLTCEKEFTVCATVCSPGCECPLDNPIWHQGTCISRAQCLTLDERNITVLDVASNNDKNHNGNMDYSVEEKDHDYKPEDVFLNRDKNTGVSALDDPPNSDSLQHGGRSQKLNDFFNDLWQLNLDTFDNDFIKYNLQGKNNVSGARDVAPNKFFQEAGYAYFHSKGPVFTSFIDLLGCYDKNAKRSDPMSAKKTHAVHKFLDSVLENDIFKATEVFLNGQGHKNRVSFRQTLYDMWFEPYSRSTRYNTSDSSGFEHVFVGEVRGRKIIGLHNWVQFYLLEHQQDLNYYGHIHESFIPHNQRLIAINMKYTWQSHRRKQGSLLIGTSPDFELALYTVCFILHPNTLCEFDIEGAPLHISTYDVKHVPGWQVLAAFPIV